MRGEAVEPQIFADAMLGLTSQPGGDRCRAADRRLDGGSSPGPGCRGGGTTWALTADAHGRLMCHNLGRHLSVAASAISSFARARAARCWDVCEEGAGAVHCCCRCCCLNCVLISKFALFLLLRPLLQGASRAAAVAGPVTSFRCSSRRRQEHPLTLASSAPCCPCTAAPPGWPAAAASSSSLPQMRHQPCLCR